MKKILIIFSIFFANNSYAKSEKMPIELFGIKLFEHITNYADIDKGKLYEYIPNTYTYSDEDLMSIKRNPLFDYYYIRTNTDFIVHNITANKSYIEKIENFQNKCLSDKSDLIKEFSIYFRVNISDFNSEYSEDEINKGIFDDTSFDFVNENTQFQIAVYCGYFPDGNEIHTVLFCSLVSHEYFLNHVKTRWKEIEPFDNNFIKFYANNINSSKI